MELFIFFIFLSIFFGVGISFLISNIKGKTKHYFLYGVSGLLFLVAFFLIFYRIDCISLGIGLCIIGDIFKVVVGILILISDIIFTVVYSWSAFGWKKIREYWTVFLLIGLLILILFLIARLL